MMIDENIKNNIDDDDLLNLNINNDDIDDDNLIDDDSILLDDDIVEELNDIVENIIDDKDEKVEEIKEKKKNRYDSIFKGKKNSEEDLEEIHSLYIDTYSGISIDEEMRDDDNYIKKNELSNFVFTILSTQTNARLSGSRRKPSKVDFNIFYSKLIENIDTSIYSKTEIFCELAQYFSDNYYSMLKMLQKDWSDEIIMELQDKYKKIDLRKIDFL